MDDTRRIREGQACPTREAALDYAGRGWQVLPLWRPQNGVCTCRKGKACSSPGKHPRTARGFKAATTDPEKIETWKWESANIGIATCPESGLLVIDVDPRKGGMEGIAHLKERLGKLPAGPVVQTGDGWHAYFQQPDASFSSKPDIAQGVDIKAAGGYVVAPPSLHVSGRFYRWDRTPDGPLPELPESWLNFLSALYGKETETGSAPREMETGGDRGDSRDRRDSRERRSQSKTPLSSTTTALVGTGSARPSPSGCSRIEKAACCDIEEAISTTLPTRTATRHRCLFEFARALQAIPKVRDTPLDELKPYVRDWVKRAQPFIANATEFIDNWEDFSESWDKVRYPRGETIMTEVLERAEANPDTKAIEDYDSEKAGVLVAICRELQREAGDQPFYLSCQVAGKLIGITPKRAWKWLRLLCREGRLEVAAKGNPHRATRYRYLGELA